ncbi:hypothetical protein H1Q59_05135 [Holosporaceae bacterium 'Namur']|nr:hypothetical protein [Holosporaceae bacterium 'Namur']
MPSIQVVILYLIYVITLHPYSGGLGGFIFIFTGWIIPTLINLIISHYISFKIFNFSKIKSLALMVCISFVMGLNIRIVYLFNGIEHNRALYSTIRAGGNEGCMCMYFDVPGKGRIPLKELPISSFLIYASSSIINSNIWTYFFRARELGM